VGIDFELNIQNYTLLLVKIAGVGTAELAVEAEFAYSFAKTYSNDITLTTITMNPIDFAIGGVPFSIDITVPVHGGNSHTFFANNYKDTALK
jgi:hypothetical protein